MYADDLVLFYASGLDSLKNKQFYEDEANLVYMISNQLESLIIRWCISGWRNTQEFILRQLILTK